MPIKDADELGREAVEPFVKGYTLTETLNGSLGYVVDYGTYMPIIDQFGMVVGVTSVVEVEENFIDICKRMSLRVGETLRLKQFPPVVGAWKPVYAEGFLVLMHRTVY
jgi:hypothetical protein